MADPRPFRFRLPWLVPQTTVPAPTPTPSRPAGETQVPTRPATAPAPPRPPFPAAGPAPAQPPPRTEPPPPAPSRAVSQPQAAPPRPSASRAATPSRAPTQPPPPLPKTEPSSPPPTAAKPQTTLQKPTSPPALSPPTRPSTPSSPAQVSPQAQPLAHPPSPPKREPEPIPEVSQIPTPLDQSSSSPKEPERLETQPDLAHVSEIASDSAKQPQGRIEEPTRKETEGVANGEPKLKEVPQLPEPIPSPTVSPGSPREDIFQKKEVVATSETRKPAETFIPHHPKVSKAHNHKPATSNGDKTLLHREIKEDISKFVHKLGAGQGKLPLDGDKPFTIITLAGENRGASMTLSNEVGKREKPIHIHRGYKANPDESADASTDAEENSSRSKKHRGPGADEEMETNAYINSNVQGVNNSLVFNGSVSTGSPGVQYAISHKPRDPIKGKHEAEEHTMHKDEFSFTPSEKHAYAPTVRRRSLRGLFLESSDSDPDNAEKHQRHGCRYACKDSNIDIL